MVLPLEIVTSISLLEIPRSPRIGKEPELLLGLKWRLLQRLVAYSGN
jgi:hypothetical protein